MQDVTDDRTKIGGEKQELNEKLFLASRDVATVGHVLRSAKKKKSASFACGRKGG